MQRTAPRAASRNDFAETASAKGASVVKSSGMTGWRLYGRLSVGIASLCDCC